MPRSGTMETARTRFLVIHFGMVISALTMVILGLELSFSVYAIPLKKLFNYSQTEVEVIASAGIAGMGLSLAESLITANFGYKAGYLVIWISNTVAAFGFFWSTVYKEFFSSRPMILAGIQFLFGAAQNAGSTRLVSIAVTKVSRANEGKVVGVFYSFTSISNVFYGLVLEKLFDEDLRYFYLFVVCACGISVALCFFFHRPTIEHQPVTQTQTASVNNAIAKDHKFPEIIHSMDFHLIFWPSCICYAVYMTVMNNMAQIADSLGIERPMLVVYFLSMIMTVGRILYGSIFDHFYSIPCGLILLLFSCVCVMGALVIYVLHFKPISLNIIAVAIGLGMSGTLTIPITLLTLIFGRSNLPYFLGIIYIIASFFSLLFQCFLGYIYDSHSSGFGNICSGLHCFYLSFLFCLGFLGFSSVCYFVYLVTELRRTSINNQTGV